MGVTTVVKVEVLGQCLSGNGNGIVAVQIHFIVFHGLPEAFDKDVIAPATFAIHTDLNAVLFEHANEGRAGELTALIGVMISDRPYFRMASSSASTQGSAVSVLDRRQARTRRVAQSSTAER